ncbi:MAG: LysM peptidoglycan-binding domain-containing protein [Flavobacteriales bacterium]|nr:LysM peptidoglycan-binding domain-containing protein [Flavobacteriales bacterium]
MRLIPTLLFTITSCAAMAQSTWRVDSLMTTWPVRLAVADSRHGSTPGVIRAVDTRNLYTQLQHTVTGFPVFADSGVVRYVDLYGEPKREEFRALLGMAQVYFPMIEGELVRQGLSKDFKYLPMALSAMNTLAGSQQGEAGLWMLSYPVALRYGLNITADRDERRDTRLSTMAAVSYLKDLLARYHDPALAVMAFTCGPANVTRAQGRTSGATDYRTLYPQFTEGSRDVLPLLMAFIHLSAHAKELGIAPIPMLPAEAADTLRSDRELRFSAVSRTLGIEMGRLRALNPLLCGDRIPRLEAFVLPRGGRAQFEALADSLLREQQRLAAIPAIVPAQAAVRTINGREAINYRVRSGDYLGHIAMRFGVKVSQIKSWNHMRSDRIDIGDKLVIYVTASQRDRYDRHKAGGTEGSEGPTNQVPIVKENVVRAQTPLSEFTWYTVQSGDSLYGIAQRFPGVDAKRLMEVNGITADIKPGQRLKIPLQQ